MKDDRFTVVDLFAGCGGLSYGLESTGLFNVVAAVDNFEDALRTYSLNHEDVEIFAGDIRKISNKQIGSWNRIASEIDLVVGGPPCEGFSQNKRREFTDPEGVRRFGRNLSFISDPRNYLFREFLRFVTILRPKIVLIENVPQILNHKEGAIRDEILLCLRRGGYLAQAKVLLSSRYGVPQKRRRAIILGVREDIHQSVGFARWPKPTHGELADDADLTLLQELSPFVTVSDAIGDLPLAGRTTGLIPYTRRSPSEYARRMRRGSRGVTWHMARRPGPSVLSRLNALTPGMRLDHLPRKLRTRSYYFNAYGRLSWDEPAKTITKSCNYLGSGCFGHPQLNRGITMREAARLQSFPDSFRFESERENSVAKQIGGAVPPLLAQALGVAIAEHLVRWKAGELDVA